MIEIQVTKVAESATSPVHGSPGAAGWDLCAATSRTIEPGQIVPVPTGIAVAIPPGYVGLIWPRSGLAVKHGIDTMAGVIDSDYRGEVGVVLVNHGTASFVIEPGDRIAQIVFQKVADAECREVATLTPTARGSGGFGSTGR